MLILAEINWKIAIGYECEACSYAFCKSGLLKKAANIFRSNKQQIFDEKLHEKL